MHVVLPLRKGRTTIKLNRSQKPHKVVGRAKAIRDVSLSELSDEDRIRVLVFGLELAKSPRAGKGNTKKEIERDIESELVYWIRAVGRWGYPGYA